MPSACSPAAFRRSSIVRRVALSSLTVVLLALSSSMAGAQEREPADETCRRALFPSGHIYQPYLADPGRSGFALAFASYASSDLEEAGDTRILVRIGGIYGLFARQCGREDGGGDGEAAARRPWQIDFSAGFLGQFDAENQLDSIAWDGFYSLMFTWGRSDGWSYRAGFLHDSAHLGDEFAEETGRRRLNYTHEEVIAAASWSDGRHWRVYGEAGMAFNTGDNDVQEDLRGQLGAEWVGDPMRRWASTRWYLALDGEALETRDFEPRVTLQTGLMLVRDDGADLYRFGLEATTGPSVMGELILEDETYVGLGMWFDI